MQLDEFDSAGYCACTYLSKASETSNDNYCVGASCGVGRRSCSAKNQNVQLATHQVRQAALAPTVHPSTNGTYSDSPHHCRRLWHGHTCAMCDAVAAEDCVRVNIGGCGALSESTSVWAKQSCRKRILRENVCNHTRYMQHIQQSCCVVMGMLISHGWQVAGPVLVLPVVWSVPCRTKKSCSWMSLTVPAIVPVHIWARQAKPAMIIPVLWQVALWVAGVAVHKTALASTFLT